jgi:hypothetical protein
MVALNAENSGDITALLMQRKKGVRKNRKTKGIMDVLNI